MSHEPALLAARDRHSAGSCRQESESASWHVVEIAQRQCVPIEGERCCRATGSRPAVPLRQPSQPLWSLSRSPGCTTAYEAAFCGPNLNSRGWL
jgi:hypothetical protein